MAMLSVIWKMINFYGRFTPTFSRTGYFVRRLTWPKDDYDLTGQTWLVTGATGGIGRAAALAALRNGASVIVAARNADKLAELVRDAGDDAARLTTMTVDLSLQSDTQRMVDELAADGAPQIDVLVNNVGILNREFSLTPEGRETSYATNLLNHHLLTEGLLGASKIPEGGRVVNVTSGGLYNVPLNIKMLNMPEKHYSGFLAYAAHKRAQLALSDHYRAEHQGKGVKYYTVHPGWAATQGVRTSLPRFRVILGPILRTPAEGADTIVWLGATAPEEVEDKVWFDRKPRPPHVYPATREPKATIEQVVTFLEDDLARGGAPAEPAAAPANASAS